MNSLKVGMTTSVIVAFLIGLGLVTQDHSLNIFNLYFTVAVPIALTAGALAYSISKIIRSMRSSKEKRGE